jgi:hypothetical protein
LFGELEQEVVWKTVDIALDGLQQHLGLNAVNLCEVAVEHDLLAANHVDAARNAFDSE